MDLSSEPATPQQLFFLEQHGHSADSSLTRAEAAALIRKVREGHSARIPEGPQAIDAAEQPYFLGLACSLSSRVDVHDSSSKSHLQPGNPVYSKRQEFWMDTCREVTQMHTASAQVHELYKVYGCRFSLPSTEEVQEVLDALDAAMADWETTHPELFYSTLELNFPELLKRQV